MGEDILIELIILADKKIEYLKEMLSITKDQAEFIQNEEVEKLEHSIDKKDILIQNIDKIDNIFKEKRLNYQIEDNRLIEKLSNIKNIVSSIKLIDDENNKNLKEAIADMGGKLKEVRHGQRAMKGYDGNDPYKAFAAQGGTLFINQNS